MTLIKALFKNTNIQLDERESKEFNRIYRSTYLLLLIAVWLYFELMVLTKYEIYYFSGVVGTICLIGTLRMLFKGLSITYRNLDIIIPTLYFTGCNILFLTEFIYRIVTNKGYSYNDHFKFYGLIFIFAIVVYFILNIIYKTGLKNLEKELE